MTVVNASSSYCYSILLTVLFCHSFLPARPSPSPLTAPSHPADSQSNKGAKKKSNKNITEKLHIQS